MDENMTMDELVTEEQLPDYEAAVLSAVAARNEAEEKYRRLEARLYCIENGIDSDNADDVILLAERMGDNIMETIPEVLKKYPFFAENKRISPVTTGVHISVSPSTEMSGVEAAFRRSNPSVKF